jgi:hypothetical protein
LPTAPGSVPQQSAAPAAYLNDVLDWTYIEERLMPRCELKGEPELVEHLMRMRVELHDRG